MPTIDIRQNEYKDLLKQLKQVPDEVIFQYAKERRKTIREKLGKWATMKRYRKCKGCGKRYYIREMRSHPCVISWKKR